MLKRAMPPSHPGRILQSLFLEPLGVSQGDFAENLGVTRKTLSMLINERQGISAEMALRLSKALGTTTDIWIRLQNSYDLWYAKEKVNLSAIKAYRRPRNPLKKSAKSKKTAK